MRGLFGGGLLIKGEKGLYLYRGKNRTIHPWWIGGKRFREIQRREKKRTSVRFVKGILY